MPFVEGGLVEEIPQAAPTGGFVENGLAEDPTPEDAYNIVRGFMSAQHDVAPSKQEFLQYEKVSKEKPYPWRELPGAVVQTGKELVGLPQKAVETVAEAVYQPSFADTQAMIGATQAEVALRSKERAKDIGLGLIDTILNQYDKATGASAEESDQKRYDRFLARSDIKRNLIRAQTGQQPSVDVQTMQQLGIPTESISQQGVQVGEFMAAPENIAFAGGGKLAGMALQQAGRALPAVGSAMRATGERIYNVAGFPERFAGAAATALTGSEAAGQRAAQAVSAGSAAITGAEIAGVEGLSASVPVLPTLAKGISAGKAAGATLETVGEAAQVAGGPSLSAAQQYLLNAGERIAAAPGASASTKALGTFIAKSGVEAPAIAAMKILIPAAGGGLAGGLFAGMTGEEKDAIVHSIGGGIAFGALDSAFNLSKAAASGALNGQRVRSAAVADLNARPETAQFTFIDNLGNTTDSTLNDKASRSALYNKLDDAQLTKTLSEVANAEAAGTDVIFHDSSAQLPKGIDAISYKGVYIPPESIKAGRPTILINVDKVSPETLPHELVHARVTPDFIRQVSSNVLEGKIDEVQFKDFANKYANQLESAGSKQLADKMRDDLVQSFNPNNTRAQRVDSIKNIVDEFTSYYAQEWLAGRDAKKLLPGRIPAWYESAFNKAKEVVSDKFSRRALQAGFDPVSRSFYDASGKRLRIPWMEDSIDKLVAKNQGFEGIERKIDTRSLSRAEREALIQSKGWTDLYQLAPDGSIQRPLSPKEVSQKTAEIAKRTTDVLEAMPKDKRASKTALDDKGEPVVQGRLSPEEAKAISDSGIFSPSTSRFLIEMAKGMIQGNLFDTKYWKVYGRSGKAGVFGESDKTILPYAISINSKGGVNIKVVDWSKVQGRMQSALKKSQYKNLFKNYDDAYRTMRDVYLKNLADPLSQIESADALGGGVEGNRKRNFFNEVMGAVPKVADVMINAPTAGYEASRKGGSVYQDLRLERIQDLVENGDKIPWSGDMGETSSYRRTQLNWQPAEQIGDTTAKSDSIGGYRILSSGDKFRLYAPSGEKVGIFDTEGQAKLKAEKAYATSQRIQQEVGQQEYQSRNEVGQTAEAGGGYRNVGGQEGGAEGRQAQRQVRQEGDVVKVPDETVDPGTPAPDSGIESIPLEGTPIRWEQPPVESGQRFMPAPQSNRDALPTLTPELLDQIKSQTKTLAAIHIDRMKVGEYKGIPLQGGMFYPTIGENLKNGVVWAFNSQGTARGVANKAAQNNGFVKLVLMQEGNVIGNRTFTHVWFKDLQDNIASKRISKTTALRELNSIREKFAKHSDSKLATGHTKTWKTLEEAFSDIVSMPQQKRASTYFQKSKAPTKGEPEKISYQSLLAQKMTKQGFPDAIQIVSNIEEPAFKGIPTGAAVGIIKIDPIGENAKILTGTEAGVPEHLSYDYVLKGKPVAKMSVYSVVEQIAPETKGLIQKQASMSFPVEKSVPIESGAGPSIRYMPTDADYLAAVKSGDTGKAKQMVDQAAKASGYTEARYYHGSTSGQKPGNVLDRREVFFLTKRQDIAEKYSNNKQVISVIIPRNQKVLLANGPNDILSILPKELSKPHIDNKYSWEVLQDPNLPGLYEDSDVIGFLRDELGYDGIKIKDDVAGGEQHESLAWFRTENIKSADPITYDNSGNVIPLSQRFQQSSQDIRFMPDASMPGVYSMGSYRVMPSKTGNRYRVYGPIGQLIGIAANLDDAQRMIQRKLK